MERLQTGQERSSTSKVIRLNTVPAGQRYAMVMPSYFSSLSMFNAKRPPPHHHDMQEKTILAFRRIVHKIQTQYPHFQRLMMSSKDGVGQVIKAFVTVVILIALTGRFRVIKAALDHMFRLTRGTLDAIRPAQLTNRLITLHIVDEMLDVNLHGC